MMETPLKRQRVKAEGEGSASAPSPFTNMKPGEKKKAFDNLVDAAKGETLPLHFLKAKHEVEKSELMAKHHAEYEQAADKEAQYIVNGLVDCTKKTYVVRLGQLATRERARAARQEEAEIQHRLDLAEGEALMRELEMDEGKMSYWLHSHRRCQPPKCIGFLPPKCCCPGGARGSRD